MNDAARLLDGDLTAAEMDATLERLRHDPELRDALTTEQLVRDAAGGLRALDRGYTLRILARLRAARGPDAPR
jgi:negative regulator of sigma E activity